VNESDEQKKGRQFFRKTDSDSWHADGDDKKISPVFFEEKIGKGLPTFFSEQGPAESKSGPDLTQNRKGRGKISMFPCVSMGGRDYQRFWDNDCFL